MDEQEFITKSKYLVFNCSAADDISEVFVIQSHRNQKNYIAALATDFPNSQYFEVRYNGAMEEFHITNYERRGTIRADKDCNI